MFLLNMSDLEESLESLWLIDLDIGLMIRAGLFEDVYI